MDGLPTIGCSPEHEIMIADISKLAMRNTFLVMFFILGLVILSG
jgi:hypothetical protein